MVIKNSVLSRNLRFICGRTAILQIPFYRPIPPFKVNLANSSMLHITQNFPRSAYVTGTTYRIITHIAGCGSKMDDSRCLWTRCCEGVNMCHDVMPTFFLLNSSKFEINLVNVGLHLCKLFIADVQAKSLKHTGTMYLVV